MRYALILALALSGCGGSPDPPLIRGGGPILTGAPCVDGFENNTANVPTGDSQGEGFITPPTLTPQNASLWNLWRWAQWDFSTNPIERPFDGQGPNYTTPPIPAAADEQPDCVNVTSVPDLTPGEFYCGGAQTPGSMVSGCLVDGVVYCAEFAVLAARMGSRQCPARTTRASGRKVSDMSSTETHMPACWIARKIPMRGFGSQQINFGIECPTKNITKVRITAFAQFLRISPEVFGLMPFSIKRARFDGLPLDQYLAPALILPIFVSRGYYWGRCAFCPHGRLYRGRFRSRNAAEAVDVMTHLSQKCAARCFYFVDEAVPPGASPPRRCGAVPSGWAGQRSSRRPP